MNFTIRALTSGTITVVFATVYLLIAVAAFGSARTADAQGTFISGYEVIAGADRYETNAMLLGDAFPDGADVVYVVTGEDYPDALSAAAAGFPILLVPRDGTLPELSRRAFARLTAQRASVFITFVGGDHAISPGMRSQVLQAQGSTP